MRVEFDSEGAKLVGDFKLPPGNGPFPGVVLLGPLTSVKEQATGSYAQALAERGYAALSFDPRHFGESEGEPRQYENPEAKIADVRAALSLLERHGAVDDARLAVVGVCAGAGYMAGAVATDPRVRAFGTVAGFFHSSAKQREWMGDEAVDAAVARAKAAREVFERDGTSETIPAVGEEGDVAMPLAEAYEYYGTARGQVGGYVNAFAVMSREKTLPYDSMAHAAKIEVPVVMVHSESALAPALARAFHDALAAEDKALHWVESTGQIDFYDDPGRIALALDRVCSVFDRVL